jgi:hypothetical protein
MRGECTRESPVLEQVLQWNEEGEFIVLGCRERIFSEPRMLQGTHSIKAFLAVPFEETADEFKGCCGCQALLEPTTKG